MRFPWVKIAVLVLLIGGGLWLASTLDKGPCQCRVPAAGNGAEADPNMSAATTWPSEETALPRLLDLGSKSCTPCKMMEPVLAGLQQSHSDQFITEFVDVAKNPQVGQRYRINAIPTQIFLDASGHELFRHEGFMPRQAILAKWGELGVDVRQ
jgi:thioredoxin 1